jgi:hypothetical protein
MQNPCSSSFI